MSSDLVELRSRASFEPIPSAPGDRYFDYCLQPYQPRRPPKGNLRAENLLWQSLHVSGCAESFRAPLRALQQSLGRDMTVWGTKFDGRDLWWELYVYDPRKEDPAATLDGLRRTLAPWVEMVPTPRESIPYMMVSFDLFSRTFDERRPVSEVNLYLTGTPGHEGRSYRLEGSSAQLENTYCFMEPKRDIDRVLPLLKSSVFVDYSDPKVLSRVLIPELFGCKKVCIAKKRHRDAIYYSGIDVEMLLWFLRRFGYPPALVDFVARDRQRFEHLYFDVGIDYEQDTEGSIHYTKTSFYGTI